MAPPRARMTNDRSTGVAVKQTSGCGILCRLCGEVRNLDAIWMWNNGECQPVLQGQGKKAAQGETPAARKNGANKGTVKGRKGESSRLPAVGLLGTRGRKQIERSGRREWPRSRQPTEKTERLRGRRCGSWPAFQAKPQKWKRGRPGTGDHPTVDEKIARCWDRRSCEVLDNERVMFGKGLHSPLVLGRKAGDEKEARAGTTLSSMETKHGAITLDVSRAGRP